VLNNFERQFECSGWSILGEVERNTMGGEMAVTASDTAVRYSQSFPWTSGSVISAVSLTEKGNVPPRGVVNNNELGICNSFLLRRLGNSSRNSSTLSE
jgi:hypothetical protein